MRTTFIFMLLCVVQLLQAEELKVVAKNFEADELKGYTIFTGNVAMSKGSDEFNASKVTVYVDKNRKPTKFIAKGKVSFLITTLTQDVYKGKAEEVHFFPQKKEYRFYNNVHIKQLNKPKEINGDEVVIDVIEGRAYAKGAEQKPVIMIFNIEDTNQTK
ncbi:MAG: lipopolysaccharide transport periplasmic protein LptA [Sulfurimonadaceae bacterium]|nr:lipopolysaccharide transport periplasmic protein LptA [Sulfurimonadaceae bacterium]